MSLYTCAIDSTRTTCVFFAHTFVCVLPCGQLARKAAMVQELKNMPIAVQQGEVLRLDYVLFMDVTRRTAVCRSYYTANLWAVTKKKDWGQ